MSTDSQSQCVSELQAFYAFVGSQLTNEKSLSPEDLVEIWRENHPHPSETDATVAALRAALADMDAGDTGIPIDEFDRQFRARHGLPPRT